MNRNTAFALLLLLATGCGRIPVSALLRASVDMACSLCADREPCEAAPELQEDAAAEPELDHLGEEPEPEPSGD